MSKNILNTRVAGFIRSGLYKHFFNIGYKVRAFDNFSVGNEEKIKSIITNQSY
jgi:UDP-glucose 4-epimerase